MHLPKANSPEGKRMDCSRLDIPGESLERMLLDGPLRDVQNNMYECKWNKLWTHIFQSADQLRMYSVCGLVSNFFPSYGRKIKVRKNGRQKRGSCFATLLQIELNSDDARLTIHESNLSCNKSGCCRLRNDVADSREWFYFLQQTTCMLRV